MGVKPCHWGLLLRSSTGGGGESHIKISTISALTFVRPFLNLDIGWQGKITLVELSCQCNNY